MLPDLRSPQRSWRESLVIFHAKAEEEEEEEEEEEAMNIKWKVINERKDELFQRQISPRYRNCFKFLLLERPLKSTQRIIVRPSLVRRFFV